MNILIFAAHPDDEVLGMGATIKKLSGQGNTISLCVVTEGASAQYSNKKMIQKRKNSCLSAGKILGIKNFDFLNYPDMKLDTVSHVEINKSFEKIIKKYDPRIVYIPTNTDLNKDHQIVHDSVLIAARPFKSSVKKIFSYEIPGSSKIQFDPNVYENIEKDFIFKIKSFKKYDSEIEKFPHPRSLDFLDALSKIRGSESGLKKAEAFKLIKEIID